MKPVIALVGSPNVGKSTLFNRLTRSRDALVADQPGLTRDRIYGVGKHDDHSFIVIDTGGISGNLEGLDGLMLDQVWNAIDEADVVCFLTDGRAGLNASDQDIAQQLRRRGKPIQLVVNKAEGLPYDRTVADFLALGFGEPSVIASAHGQGVREMLSTILTDFPIDEASDEEDGGPRIAVVGRPNVGKSTLINRLLGEERVVTCDMPGTTRDSIAIPFERDGQAYTLIDTAGIRRRSRVDDMVEKFSVVKALKAIEDSNVVISVIDAQEDITDQDVRLLGHALTAGRALVIAVNKWDHLPQDQRETIRYTLSRKLTFVDYADIHFISALHGTGVGDLTASVDKAYESAMKHFPTPLLSNLLEDMVRQHQPPIMRSRRIKLRYAHQGGRNPPVIVIHGNQVERVPDSYKRYLSNTFRKVLKLHGTPLRIEFKSHENPFAGRRNTLTPRQEYKRKRLIKRAKKNKKKG
ncbi:MAG: ribosome biogenesis GTPase Der [Gammaproteobacteria bacterium]|nr:MAG: ribosome biogenesis GTPase Der [Gammaproteobacteria bacterium]